jgi:hypothetical protein
VPKVTPVKPEGPAEICEAEVLKAQDDLRRRFAKSGGCMARSDDFARLYPSIEPQWVDEALHRLAEEGIAQMQCLPDGSFVFHFPAG